MHGGVDTIVEVDIKASGIKPVSRRPRTSPTRARTGICSGDVSP
jgi:hypothetical protein